MNFSSYERKIDATVMLTAASFARGMLALVPMIALASTFGLGPITDAYLVSLYLTRVLSRVLRLGTLQKIYTTLFAQRTTEGTLEHLRQPISNLINISIAGLVPLAMLLVVLAPYLVPIMAPGFDEPTRQMVVEMVQLLFSLILYEALVSLFVGIFYACQSFTLPAISSVVPGAIIAIAAVSGLPRFGIFALVWGNILAAFVHLVLLYFGMIRLGFRHHLVLRFRDQDVWETVKLVSPFYASGLVVEGRRLITLVLMGSMLPVGGLSALMYAVRITGYIRDKLFGPVMTVTYPSLVQGAAESAERMRQHMTQVLRMFNYLAFPFLAFFVIFSEDVIQVIFRRGAFDEGDVGDVALAVVILTVGLLPKGLNGVFSNAMMALRRTGWLNIFKVTNQFVITGLGLVLFPLFGLAGIAAATASATGLMTLQQALYLNRRLPISKIVAKSVSIKIISITLISGGIAYVLRHVVGEASSLVWWMQAGRIVLLSMPAGVVYIILSRYLKIAELGVITAYLSDRLQIERWLPSMYSPKA